MSFVYSVAAAIRQAASNPTLLILPVVAGVMVTIVYMYIRNIRTRHARLRSQWQQSVNTRMNPSEVIAYADRVYLTRGWSVKARNETTSIYERRIYGNIGVTILLVCLTVIGGILYYFLSGRTDVMVITLQPQRNYVTTIYFDTSGCRKMKSLECADAFVPAPVPWTQLLPKC